MKVMMKTSIKDNAREMKMMIRIMMVGLIRLRPMPITDFF